MTANRDRAVLQRIVLVGVVLSGVGLLRSAGELSPELWRPARAGDGAHQAPGKYLGASTCDGAACHAKPEARKEPPYLQEYTSWSSVNTADNMPYDRHSYAFKRLKPKDKGGDDKSASIMQKLNALEKTSASAVESERCLSCHGVSVHDYGVGKNNPGAAVGLAKELQGGKFRPDDGVSCDGCHGPAEKWLKKHDKPSWTIAEWKKLGAKEGGSQKLYDAEGIYYSKDLELWARQCVRCHLRIDTNLVDAGHPDLQPFELFSQSQQVPHWRDYTTAKPSPELPAAGPFHASVVWQTGQAVALESALAQVVVRARGTADVARVRDAFERARGHHVVLRHALARVAPDDAKTLEAAVASLEALVKAEKPDLAKVAASADKLARTLAPLVRKAADFPADLAHVTAVLGAVARDPALLEGQRSAEQGAKAIYALTYAYLAATTPDALAASPPVDPLLKAAYALGELKPDPKSADWKKALEAVTGALPK